MRPRLKLLWKRMFPAAGSSSKKGNAMEKHSPAIDRSCKPKFSEQKEYLEGYLSRVDMEEDSDYASLMDSDVDGSAKGKKVLLSNSAGDSGVQDEDYGDDGSPLSDGSAELEDSGGGANLYFSEDECDEKYYDGILSTDHDKLEAHFDHMELPSGVEAPVPWLVDSSKNDTKGPTASTSTSSGNSLRGSVKTVVDEVVLKFENFAKFDTVSDYSDHHFRGKPCAAKLAPKNWSKRIQDEWMILEKNLPGEIYVRAYESRMDLLRAVIIGAQGTPYHDGLFFFDIYFPSSYPQSPPDVYYHSGGLRINPNLYNCGRVCLSLLGTWSGSPKEMWIPGKSTILQVLVSIQGLILNAQPYFNEPGYEMQKGTKAGDEKSSAYNEKTFMHSLKTMVYSMQRPPKHFEDFVVGYFRKNARYILVSCVACMNGAPLSGVVSEKGDKRCSEQLRTNIGSFINLLVQTFTDIGAQDCQDFLTSANKNIDSN